MSLLPYLLPLIFSFVILTGLGIYSLRFRHVPAAVPFALSMFLVAAWALNYFLDLSSHDLPVKIFWMESRFLFVSTLPVAWFAMAVRHTGLGRHLTRARIGLLLLLPAVTSILSMTSGSHELFRYDFSLFNTGPLTTLLWKTGPWYLVYAVYTQSLFLFTVILFIRSMGRSRGPYRRQTGLILMGTVLPLITNLLYETGFTPVPGYNYTPSALIITGFLIAWALFRFRMFDVIPIARSIIMEGMNDLILVMDWQDRLLDFNTAARKAFRLSPGVSLGRPADAVMDRYPDLLRRYQNGSQGVSEIIVEDEGRKLYFDLTLTPIRDGHDRLLGRLILLRDVTDQKLVQDAIRENELKLITAQRLAHVGSWDFDSVSGRPAWSEEMFHIFGLDPLRGEPDYGEHKNYIHPDDWDKFDKAVQRMTGEGKGYEVELRIVRPDGSLRHIVTRGEARNESEGKEARFFGTTLDITDRKKAENDLQLANRRLSEQLAEIEILHARVKEQAIRDPLTDLFNRRYLEETLVREFSRAAREGYPVILAMIDVDHFKSINDTFGHKAGDRLLQELSRQLRTNIRQEDIACRFGGEEFVLLLPRMPLEIAVSRAEQWRATFEATRLPQEDAGLCATISIGIAVFPRHGRTGDDLIAAADKALYAAKAEGRNRVVVRE